MVGVILMSAAQAAQVRGLSSLTPHVGLMPIALADGRFYLPVTLLDVAEYECNRAFLAALPTATLASIKALLPVEAL